MAGSPMPELRRSRRVVTSDRARRSSGVETNKANHRADGKRDSGATSEIAAHVSAKCQAADSQSDESHGLAEDGSGAIPPLSSTNTIGSFLASMERRLDGINSALPGPRSRPCHARVRHGDRRFVHRVAAWRSPAARARTHAGRSPDAVTFSAVYGRTRAGPVSSPVSKPRVLDGRYLRTRRAGCVPSPHHRPHQGGPTWQSWPKGQRATQRSVRSRSRSPRRTSRTCVPASRPRGGPRRRASRTRHRAWSWRRSRNRALLGNGARLAECEARLNALPAVHHRDRRLDIHFIHVRSKHEDALPLIV